MNESTPLRRAASMSAGDFDSGGGGSDDHRSNNSKSAARKRHVRAVASIGLFVAVVMYFGVLVRPPTMVGRGDDDATTRSSSAISSADSSGSDPKASSAALSSRSSFGPPPPSGSVSVSTTKKLQSTASVQQPHDKQPQQVHRPTGVVSTDLFSHDHDHAHSSDEDDDRVHFVPGFGAPLETQYAGLVKVNHEAVGKLFYWFFEARHSAVTVETPLLVWLNGGPGASSMTGLLTEMGPYRILHDGKLIPHEQSWTQLGHMLFVDQPVGTGYSSVRDDSGYANTQDQIAEQLYRGLQGFYRRHPEYTANPVYVCGESYAGKYVPYIAHYIHQQNLAALPADSTDVRIPLTGVAIGNGKMWPVLQTRSVPDFAIALGLIDSQQYERANIDISVCEEFHRQGRHIDAFQVCQSVTDSIYENAGNPFVYDIRKTGNSFNELTSVLSDYFNSDDVRRALNVPLGTPWLSTDGSSYGVSADAPPIARHLLADEMLDVPIGTFRDLLDNYRFLFYAGNMDGSSCNNLGVGRMIDRLAWTGTVDYRVAQRQPWIVDGAVAGLAKTAGNMSYVVVLNSGHLVPTDQPAAALDMMRRFLTSEPFA